MMFIKEKSFAVLAAKLSLAAPLTVFLIGILSKELENKLLTGVLAYLNCSLIVSGFGLAIFALVRMKQHGSQNIAGKAIIGIVLNGLLLWGVTLGVLRGIEESRIAREKEVTFLKEFQRLEQEKRRYQKRIEGLEDQDELERAYNEFVKVSEDAMQKIIENTEGDEKKFFEIMAAYMVATRQAQTAYSESFKLIESEGFLDYSLLTTKKDFKKEKELLKVFVEKIRAYEDFYFSAPEKMKSKFKGLMGKAKEMVNGAVQRMDSVYKVQKPIFQEYIKANILYAESLEKLLEFLEKNRAGWRFEEQVLIFENESLQSGFSILEDEKLKIQSQVYELGSKVLVQ